MAHKKGGGSTRNGRDSIGKRLGVKKIFRKLCHRREHSHPTAWNAHPPRKQRWGSEETIPSSRTIDGYVWFERKDKYRRKVSVYTERPEF